jgi:hypothetical protein
VVKTFNHISDVVNFLLRKSAKDTVLSALCGKRPSAYKHKWRYGTDIRFLSQDVTQDGKDGQTRTI